jgi:hypothetical protein
MLGYNRATQPCTTFVPMSNLHVGSSAESSSAVAQHAAIRLTARCRTPIGSLALGGDLETRVPDRRHRKGRAALLCGRRGPNFARAPLLARCDVSSRFFQQPARWDVATSTCSAHVKLATIKPGWVQAHVQNMCSTRAEHVQHEHKTTPLQDVPSRLGHSAAPRAHVCSTGVGMPIHARSANAGWGLTQSVECTVLRL